MSRLEKLESIPLVSLSKLSPASFSYALAEQRHQAILDHPYANSFAVVEKRIQKSIKLVTGFSEFL